MGGQRVRGISGGEARRVTVGLQLVHAPALLLCDEPTTGLDAAAARALVDTLAAVAAAGRTVVATLHQPRAEALARFDGAALLARGRAAYFGAAADMLPHFGALGYALPPHTNPGDFLLDLSCVDSRTPVAEEATRKRLAQLLAAWDAHTAAAFGAPPRRAPPPAPLALHAAPRAPAAPLRTQAAVLLARGALNAARDARTVAGIGAECVGVGIALGCIFYAMGDTPGALISRVSLCYLVCSLQAYQYLVYSTHVLAAELALYEREAADGLYSAAAFIGARYGVLLPQVLLFPTAYALIVHAMTGMRPEAGARGVFVAVVVAVHVCTFSLALLCVCVRRTFPQAALMANTIYVFMRLVSGLVLQLDSIPVWLRWLRRVSFLNFSLHVLAVSELGGRAWPCPPELRADAGDEGCDAYDGDATLARMGVARDVTSPAVSLVVYVLVLMAASTLALYARPRLAQLAAARAFKREAAAADAEAKARRRQPLPLTRLDNCIAAPATVSVELESVSFVDVEVPAGPAQRFRPFAPATVALRDVGVVLRPRRWQPARGAPVLAAVSLTLRPRQLTGVLGASGSGKSSLLNVIAARIRAQDATVTGAVLFNGAALRSAAARAVVGYVTQHDALLPLLTVTETLQFAARLRLPADMPPAAKELRVDTVIAELGLRHCARTAIGLDAGAAAEGAAAGSAGGVRGGLSGGEKRRVSIAVQMLTDPAVLLCDEPTSGLDAFTAFKLGATLCRLAEGEGRTVVATLHQPREGLFALLHQVALLAQGRLLYAGPGGDALLAYFEARGHACPERTNPADFVVDVASVDQRHADAEAASRARVDALIEAYAETQAGDAAAAAAGAAEDAGEAAALLGPGGGTERGLADAPAGAAAPQEPPAPGAALSMARPTGSFVATAPLLLRRSALNLRRQPGVLSARMFQGISFGIVLCCFFTRLPGSGQPAVQNRIGLLYELMGLTFVGMLNCVAVFPGERNVFYRETADGAYGTSAFVLTYTALELPCELLTGIVYGVMFGPIAGLRSSPARFWRLAYAVFCAINAGESIGIFICGIIYHLGLSVTAMSILLSAGSAMCGFFSIGMPAWLHVVNHASVLKYCANILAANEFEGLRLEGGVRGEDVLALYRFHPAQAGRDVWVLGILVLLYRLVATLTLHLSKGRHA